MSNEAAQNSSNLSPSFVRTGVPLVAGYIASWLARHGLDVNDDNASLVIGLVFSYLYYVVARFLEVTASPKWGYILGSKNAPVYSPPLPDNDNNGGGGEGSYRVG